jgi:fibronectin type 3 domain-containing protein
MNRNSKIKYLSLLFVFLLSAKGVCQKGADAQVQVIARALPDSIMLRWAPPSPAFWEAGNKLGYTINRITIMRDGELLDKPEKLELASKIVPLPLEHWEAISKKDKRGLIAAQALYGEQMEISGTGNFDFYQVYQKAKESELRFSLALFVADQSRLLAEALGLYFVDKSTKENEHYLYEVALNDEENLYPAYLKGTVYLGNADYEALPQPLELSAEFNDGFVNLKWNYKLLETIYGSYFLERSSDGGKTFVQVSKQPIVPIEAPGKGNQERWYIYKIDSLPENHQTYYYRVKGVNAFGEIGPPSAVVFGEGKVKLKGPPQIVKHQVFDNQVKLSWHYPYADSAYINHFRVYRGTSDKYIKSILADDIGHTERSFVDRKPLGTNYYQLVAVDNYGNEQKSFSILAQLVDSIPPHTPIGVEGIIDTSGIVTLSWEANTDSDILGYRIYRANAAEEEYSQITSRPLQQNEFRDSISLNNLSKNVFYKVMAIDLRQNHSGLSKAFALKKPDKIAPPQPVLRTVSSTEKGVFLSWEHSSFEIDQYMLYRSIAGQNRWELIGVIDPAQMESLSYLDDKISSNNSYEYTVLALKGNLESSPSKPVTGKKIDKGVRESITHFYGTADKKNKRIRLALNYAGAEEVERMVFYRAVNEEPYAMYRSIHGFEKSFTDKEVSLGKTYQYKVMLIFKKGEVSQLSKEVKLEM